MEWLLKSAHAAGLYATLPCLFPACSPTPACLLSTGTRSRGPVGVLLPRHTGPPGATAIALATEGQVRVLDLGVEAVCSGRE